MDNHHFGYITKLKREQKKNNDIKYTYSTPKPMHITHTCTHVAHIELSRTVAPQKKTHERLTIFEIEALNVILSTHHHRSVAVLFVRVKIPSQSYLFILPMYE